MSASSRYICDGDASTCESGKLCCKLNTGVSGQPSNTNAPNADTDTVALTNPLTGNSTSKSIPELLGTIISYVMGIIGSLALVMFIYGGATWMLSAGNQEQVTKGKNIIIWAALGIAIIFTSYALVKFVIDTMAGAT
jgi:Type IV secretion system pilin